MNNSDFLNVLMQSFLKYLETGSRSNEKLKILHGAIANDLFDRIARLNTAGDIYSVSSLGYNNGKEGKISGRYMDKSVDIVISNNSGVLAGVAVKYVMSNYKQNSNNYFENMLGETANIRSNNVPYFQIFVIPDRIPYFDRDGLITRWEYIDATNLRKYQILSTDNPEIFMHTPNKTLVYIVHFQDSDDPNYIVHDRNEYESFWGGASQPLALSNLRLDFANSVIYNDYESFINRVVHYILSI